MISDVSMIGGDHSLNIPEMLSFRLVEIDTNLIYSLIYMVLSSLI